MAELSLARYRRSASELGSEVRYVSSVPHRTSKTITSLGKALAALQLYPYLPVQHLTMLTGTGSCGIPSYVHHVMRQSHRVGS